MKEFMYILKNILLFNDMDNFAIENALKCMCAKVSNFNKNTNILSAGDNTLYIGIILEGEAQIVRDDIFGNRSVISKIYKGDIFGEVFACAEINTLPISVISLSNTKVLFLNYKKVILTCSSSCIYYHKMIENMLKVLANKNLSLNKKIEVISAKTTREKIMIYLLMCEEKLKSKNFYIPFNRQQLADYLCVDRSAMSAELGKMRDDGLINFNKNYFQLL